MPERQQMLVLIADRRRLVREMLIIAVSRIPGMEAAVGSEDLQDLLAQTGAVRPDVVLLGGDGYPRGIGDAVARVRAAADGSAVLVVTENEDDEVLLEAIDAGAAGFIGLSGSVGELAQRVTLAASGHAVLPPEVAGRVMERLRERTSRTYRQNHSLTRREAQILALLTDGLGNAEIAGKMGVSSNTVKNHLYSIYRKLGVNSRGQAFAEAARRGLVRR